MPLFLEYESVAKRVALLDKLKPKDINTILDYLLSKSSIKKIINFLLNWFVYSCS